MAENLAALNMKSGHGLAVMQESLLARYGRGADISRGELLELRNNAWVAAARHLAPGNLVLRQWGLIDLHAGTPAHAGKILAMMNLLSYGSSSDGGRLWAEGYSYWMYTLEVLSLWAGVFAKDEAGEKVRALIQAVDHCFAVTAYDRNGVWYPAPYGDLRDGPLFGPTARLRNAISQQRQQRQQQEPESCAFVKVKPIADIAGVAGGHEYVIQAKPVGMNTHVPAGTVKVAVRNGIPEGFRFYDGYDKKYSRGWLEWKDMLQAGRIGSILRLNRKSRLSM
jgi:hypothetical protein